MIMTTINKDNVSWWWPWIGRPVDPHMSLLGSLSHLKIIFNVWWFLDLLEKEDLLFMIQISSQSLSLVMMIMKIWKDITQSMSLLSLLWNLLMSKPAMFKPVVPFTENCMQMWWWWKSCIRWWWWWRWWWRWRWWTFCSFLHLHCHLKVLIVLT